MVGLFQNEQAIMKHLPRTEETKDYFDQLDYEPDEDPKNYVYHPINAFHMLKRCAAWLPVLLPQDEIIKKVFSHHRETTLGAYGILDVQEYHNLKIDDVANGLIIDVMTGEKYWSKNNLTFEEILSIANAAFESKYIDTHINWLKKALEVAIQEKKDKDDISAIKHVIG